MWFKGFLRLWVKKEASKNVNVTRVFKLKLIRLELKVEISSLNLFYFQLLTKLNF